MQDFTAEDTIRRQLTLRAVIFDIPHADKSDAARMAADFFAYQIPLLTPDKELAHTAAAWQKLFDKLHRMHISEADTLLVTEHAALCEAALAYRAAHKTAGAGVTVVFYERDGCPAQTAADMIVQGFSETGVQFFDRIVKRHLHLPWNILYTARTCVREITLSDLDDLYRLYEGDGITDYTEPLYARAKEECYTRCYIDSMYYYYGYGTWLVTDRVSGRLIGRAGIEHRDVNDEVWMELGYIIDTAYQGQGYATEVCQAILAYAADELEMTDMHCFIHPDNCASRRVAQKLGFAPVADTVPVAGQLLHYYRKLQ